MYVKLITRASACEEAYELALGSYNELRKKKLMISLEKNPIPVKLILTKKIHQMR